MPRTRTTAIVAPLAAALLAGALAPQAALAQQTPAPQADVIGRIGPIEVTAAELRRYLDLLPPAERAALAANPAQLAQAARTYLADRLVLKEARDTGFADEPALKARLDRAREALLSEAFLQARAQLPQGYPTEAELRAAYEANRNAFIPPRRYRLAQIFVAAPADAKTSPRLDELMGRLKAKGAAKGADFAALARQYSDARVEAARGGDLGWLAEPIIVPEIRQALAGLGKGAVTPPVRLKDGWHILRLLDMQASPGTPLPFDTVKATLAERLRAQRTAAERQTYLTTLLNKNPLAIDEIKLANLAKTIQKSEK